jgi:aminomethyltransferase
MKLTALHDVHLSLNGKMIEFFGWHIPVQYSGIIDEHLAVRNSLGLFDVSHMGNYFISGPDAAKFLSHVLTNNYISSNLGELKYTHILNPEGKVIDDMIAARLDEDRFACVPNASMIDRDLEWFQQHTGDFDVNIENVSDDYSILALQGPNAQKCLQKITNEDLTDFEFFQCRYLNLKDIPDEVMVWHSGYTGEDGFELMPLNQHAVQIWNALIEAGKEFDIKPIGLGARDTLRLEKGFLLSGQDFHEDRTSLETNWSAEWAVSWDHDFIGKDALEAQKTKGGYELFVGIELTDKGVPRTGFDILKDDIKIGTVTSGTMIPGKKVGFALGYVSPEHSEPGTELTVDIRGRAANGKVASLP